MKHLSRFNENSDNKELQKVTVVQDDSSHWYVIPNDLVSDFYNDLNNEDMVDSGDFDSKYGDYRTGGDLNIVQLYAKI